MSAACFTGHRQLPPYESAAYAALMCALDSAISDAVSHGITAFLSGGACGFDLLAAERVLAYRAEQATPKLHLIIPYNGFISTFPDAEQARYHRIAAYADDVTSVFPGAGIAAYRQRNQRLVDAAERCIAYLRNEKSGTGQTVRMAVRKGIPIVYL